MNLLIALLTSLLLSFSLNAQISLSVKCSYALDFTDQTASNKTWTEQKGETIRSIESIRNAQSMFEDGLALTLASDGFTHLSPNDKKLSFKRFNSWSFNYFYSISERDGTEYLDIELKPELIEQTNNQFKMVVSMPLEVGKTISFSWQEKAIKYAPIYSLNCEIL